MTILRDPTEDDIASATRGLSMMHLTDSELVRLYTRHTLVRGMFASRVIAAAAMLVLATRNAGIPN